MERNMNIKTQGCKQLRMLLRKGKFHHSIEYCYRPLTKYLETAKIEDKLDIILSLVLYLYMLESTKEVKSRERNLAWVEFWR